MLSIIFCFSQVDIFAQLQNASEAFRTYIRDGLAQVCVFVLAVNNLLKYWNYHVNWIFEGFEEMFLQFSPGLVMADVLIDFMLICGWHEKIIIASPCLSDTNHLDVPHYCSKTTFL